MPLVLRKHDTVSFKAHSSEVNKRAGLKNVDIMRSKNGHQKNLCLAEIALRTQK